MYLFKINTKGFTLLELLLTITLTSITLVIILGGLRLSLNSWEKGEKSIEVYQRIRNVLNRVSDDISSMTLFYYQKNKMLKIPRRYLAFEGTSTKFSFIASTRGLDVNSEQKFGTHEITYFLGHDKSGSSVLKRRERFVHPGKLFLPQDSLEIELISRVADLKIRYYSVKKDIKGKISPLGWSSSLSNVLQFELRPMETEIKQILPAAIEFNLSIYEKKKGVLIKKNLPPLILPFNAGVEITQKIELY